MKRIQVSRRQVLRGASGFTLGLPFLPSLVRQAHADISFVRPSRFISIINTHGGVKESSVYPDPSTLTNHQQILTGHQASWGPLKGTVQGSDMVVSPMLRAPTTELTDRLISKMNVCAGLDIPFDIQHHQGGHLGNYARNDGNGAEGGQVMSVPLVTIDQVMAWSPTFYKDLTGIKQRSLYTGWPAKDTYSWTYGNPTTRTGVQWLAPQKSSKAVFDSLFMGAKPGGSSGSMAMQRKPIVDLVVENYQSLRQSNRRLSAEDRRRLDDHLGRLAELQRKINAAPGSGSGGFSAASCRTLAEPTQDASLLPAPSGEDTATALNDLYVDVVVAGLICGATRIAVLGVSENMFMGYGSDWHQGVAHGWYLPDKQQILLDANQRLFRHVFLQIASKLDSVEESPGISVLDNTLMAWSNEAGSTTHWTQSVPLIMAGSAGGFLKTGIYANYQNRLPKFLIQYIAAGENQVIGYTGLTWNRWLGTALQAMGLPRTEFERGDTPGYGIPFVGTQFINRQVPGVTASAGDILPFLKA